MATLSYEELKSVVSSLITKAKISNPSFVETRDNVVGLLDKIGAIITLDTDYQQDKLYMFDGFFMSFGKTIEEYQQDLILPQDYDASGSGALSPSDPTYRPVDYSYSLGRKVIKTTIRNNNIERAVHFEAQLVDIVAMQFKRLEDSMAVYRYGLKREMLAKYIALCEEPSATTTTFAISTAYNVGAYVRKGSTGDNAKVFAVVVKAIANTNTHDWATAVANGELIPLELIQEIAKPVDTSTGEEFIEQVKKDLEVASDLSEGHSLNGNSLGAVSPLKLIVKQGVLPSLMVQTMAGAFHSEELAIPAEIVVVKDFGSADSKYWAVLMDARGMRLHNTYNATRDQVNADGDFVSVFRHTEDTAHVSRNTFIKVYAEPSA